jgi:hypothetical protein
MISHKTKEGDFELVKWSDGNENNFVVAWFRCHKEGYDLHTVSGRPFEEPDFWPFARLCHKTLMEIWYHEKFSGE